jgi:serine/threonine protein kinase
MLFAEIGHGRFSQVYRAQLSNGTTAAAKRLRPTDLWHVQREVHFLQLLQGIPHVIELIGVYGTDQQPAIVTAFASRDNMTLITLKDLQWVMRCLLTALNGPTTSTSSTATSNGRTYWSRFESASSL